MKITVKNDDGSVSTLGPDGNEVSRTEAPKVEAKAKTPATTAEAKTPLPESPPAKAEAKPKKEKAAKTKVESVAKKPEPKIDPDTEETAEEIVMRAETAGKRLKYAESANAYRRASKLVDGDAKTKLLAIADQMEAKAKEKGQPMGTKAKEEKKSKPKAKKVEKRAAAAKTAKKPSVEKKANGHANGVKKGEKGTPEHHNYPETAAEKRAAAERTAHAKGLLRKREEYNDDEKKVMEVFRKGSKKTLREIADVAFSHNDSFTRYLRVKNAFRIMRAHKLVKNIDIERDGKKLNGYERVE